MSLLEGGPFAFGSPTTVMYRSSIVRESEKFFAEALLHEDTEKCMEILQTWDFGFVHQVLSFLRTDNVNESVTIMSNLFAARELDRYIVVQRYAAAFLDEDEASELKKRERKEYYSAIAYQAVRWRSKTFWEYHRQGLRTLGESLAWPYLSLRIMVQLLEMAANPGTTVVEFIRYFKKHKQEAGVAKKLGEHIPVR
jgi:hypothetical protein